VAALVVPLSAFVLAAAMLPAQEVALTFDDLPTHPQIIESIVKSLKDAKAPQVYGFLNGRKSDELGALEFWTAAGFRLGSHGYSHLDLAETPLRMYTRNIKANEPVLRSLVPNEDQWHWFRYPFLEEGETLRKKRAVAEFLKEQHYRVAEVTLDFEDFRWNNPYLRCLARGNTKGIEWLRSSYLTLAADRIELGQKMSRRLYGRDIKHIMLLHVGAFAPVMLPDLLNLLKQKHFKLITLDDAASDPAYKIDHQWTTRHGGDFLTLSMLYRHLEIPPHLLYPKAQLHSVCTTRNGAIPPDPAAKPSLPGKRRKIRQSTPTP
jgi:peptidoglycan/xylan/chitin deacetylase (PgdA/CDA1 family)